MQLELFIGLLAGAVVGVGLYIVLAKVVRKGRRDSLLNAAEEEAEHIKKEKIFQAKERF
jgi:hypothetical protein